MDNTPAEKLDPFLNAAPHIYELSDSILAKFTRFRSISPTSVLIVFKTGKCAFSAKIAKIPSYMAPFLPNKKLILILNATEWDLMSKARRVAVLFHEFMHIVCDDEKGYKIAKHDVQEFKEMIDKVGMNYERADELLKEFEAK